MESFLRDHGALILKHARRHVRLSGLTLTPEDVAHEAELMVMQLGATRGFQPEAVPSPDAFFRRLVGRAALRVKRRRTLLAQVAAGDDLVAVSADVRGVDEDLPEAPAPPTDEEASAFAALTAFKRSLAPADALVAALWIEDDFTLEEIAGRLHQSPGEVDDARVRILKASESLPAEPVVDVRRTGEGASLRPPASAGSASKEPQLRALAARAVGPSAPEPHVDPPLIRLVADGDTSDDIADAMAHLACCPDCRAVLTEGEISRRSVVVLAIEAPAEAQRDIAEAAHTARAKLLERGEGRWTAVLEPSRVDAFKERLGKEDSSVVSRLSQADAVDLPWQRTGGRRSTLPPLSSDSAVVDVGTSAAEVLAWARMAAEQRRRTVHGPHLGWLTFAVVTIAGAATVAYVLAQR